MQQIAPPILPRPRIVTTAPAYHGALDYVELERLGLDPETILDFSVNSNPYGPAPGIKQALLTVPLDRYPDRESLALRRALGSRLDVSPAQIMIGNGTAELLWLTAFAFLQPGERALVLGPTFGEYTRLAELMGAQVKTLVAQAAHNFTFTVDEVARCLTDWQPRLLFLCTPNNPTGFVYPLEMVATWLQAHPETLFVIDEAYLAFAPGLVSTLTLQADNLLLLRSMTKDYALAGLRLGYAVSHNQAIIEALTRTRPAWNVNALAQVAGVAALSDETHQRQTLAALEQAKIGLVTGLRRLGLAPVPSATHYFLLPVGQGNRFRQALLKHNLLVRDCASFNLPTYVRLAARRPAENEKLLTAIQTLMAVAEASGDNR